MPIWLWPEDCTSGRRVDGRGLLSQPVLLAGRWRRYLPCQDGQVTAIPSSSAQADVEERTCLQPQGGINFNWLLTPVVWTSPTWLIGLSSVWWNVHCKSPFLSICNMEAYMTGCCVNSFFVDACIWWVEFPCWMLLHESHSVNWAVLMLDIPGGVEIHGETNCILSVYLKNEWTDASDSYSC